MTLQRLHKQYITGKQGYKTKVLSRFSIQEVQAKIKQVTQNYINN